MATFTIYYGAAKPIRVQGANCVRMLQFAEKYKGWHTLAKDRATKRAAESLLRHGCIEVSGDQFRFCYPKGY